jgi:hypothetical protein
MAVKSIKPATEIPVDHLQPAADPEHRDAGFSCPF